MSSLKLRLKDKVMIISGRDKGKTGEIIAVHPATQSVVVEGVNTFKKHRKPTQADPRGGIVELTKPISTSKVQILDPKSGKPARVGWTVNADGTKERVFKVATFANKKTPAKAEASEAKKTDKKKAPKTEKTA